MHKFTKILAALVAALILATPFVVAVGPALSPVAAEDDLPVEEAEAVPTEEPADSEYLSDGRVNPDYDRPTYSGTGNDVGYLRNTDAARDSHLIICDRSQNGHKARTFGQNIPYKTYAVTDQDGYDAHYGCWGSKTGKNLERHRTCDGNGSCGAWHDH